MENKDEEYLPTPRMTEQKYLSASRIKTLDTCSWQYYCQYSLKLPQKNNAGSSRGTVCHLVFELLTNKRHKKHFDLITKNKSLSSSKAVTRLVKKHSKIFGIDNEEDYQMINDMILVGLGNDFYGTKGAVNLPPEFEFCIENKEPKYNIKGFIDKPIDYPKDKKIEIIDYKSSKEKFKGEDLESNIQAMMYSLVARKMWPDKKSIVKFIFLRFPKEPIQELEFSDEALDGFEHYLSFVNKKINNFNEKSACANFAADKEVSKDDGFKGSLVCGFAKHSGQLKKDGKPMWHCPFKFDFDYYVLIDEKNEIIKSSYEENDLKKLLKANLKIEKRFYEGCPKFQRKNPLVVDNFDL